MAYHSNLYFPEFKNHVQEMKDHGFDTILFCITETDLLYNLIIFKEFREYAQSQGMQCWADYWGFNGVGEAIQRKVSIGYFGWLDEVISVGFNHFMVDEPKENVMEIFHDLNSLYANQNFHLCLSDDIFNSLADEEIKNMPVASIGVSCYMLGHAHHMKHYKRTHDIAARLSDLRPDNNFVFIQGFDLPAGFEDLPMDVKEICESYGITNFGFWAFRANCATGTKRPTNPELIWGRVKF